MWDEFDTLSAGIIASLVKVPLDEEHLRAIIAGVFVPLGVVVRAGDHLMEDALERAARQMLVTLRAVKALHK